VSAGDVHQRPEPENLYAAAIAGFSVPETLVMDSPKTWRSSGCCSRYSKIGTPWALRNGTSPDFDSVEEFIPGVKTVVLDQSSSPGQRIEPLTPVRRRRRERREFELSALGFLEDAYGVPIFEYLEQHPEDLQSLWRGP